MNALFNKHRILKSDHSRFHGMIRGEWPGSQFMSRLETRPNYQACLQAAIERLSKPFQRFFQ